MTVTVVEGLETLEEHGVELRKVDTILVHEDTYQDWYDHVEEECIGGVANYATQESPAVRVTAGTEKVTYVNSEGLIEEYEL